MKHRSTDRDTRGNCRDTRGDRRGPATSGRPHRGWGLSAAAAATATFLPAAAALGAPTFVNGGGSAGHLPGSPGGTSFGSSLVLQDGAPSMDPAFDPHTTRFPSGGGGVTNAKVGIGHVETASAVRLLLASGSGVSQSDPGDVQSASVLEFQFGANWRIDGGSFGPPIGTSFSVPVGMRIGAGGSAKFECEVHWSATVGGTEVTDARDPYVVSRTFDAGTLLTSFTAPASPFDFSSIAGGGVNTISVFGFVRFTVDNESAPSLIEFPTLADFPEFAGRPEMDIVPGATVTEVPEPASAGGLAAAALGLLGRRRRPRPDAA